MSETSELKIRIVSEPSKENPFIIIYKPHNLPSAPLSESDRDNALYKASLLFPEINNVKGRKEIEKGLVHRLDTVTSGLMLIATEQRFYDKMLEIQAKDLFVKQYFAFCDICTDNAVTLGGFPPVFVNADKLRCNDNVCTKSCFRAFGDGSKEVRPVTEQSGMAALKKLKSKTEYTTYIQILESDGKKAKVLCTISKGYRHQVRCHLAWNGLPVVNDSLYNSVVKKNGFEKDNKDIMFEACSLLFPHPFTGEMVRFEV